MIIKDQVIVITGGDKGLGKAMAEGLSILGARVVISSHDRGNLAIVADELGTDYFFADVRSLAEVVSLSEYVVGKYKVIDLWINNAGIQIAPSPIEDIPEKKFQEIIQTNLCGYFYGFQVALSQMKKQNSGAIVSISSTAGLEGKPGIAPYSASKFAIKGLIESVRREVEGLNIKILGVFPGGIQTDIYREKYPEDFKDYMDVNDVADKILSNLQSDDPEMDLVIRRPISKS